MNRKGVFPLVLRQHSKLESEEVLNILNAIKGNPEVTQRELSSISGISLGKINFLLKSLVEKGWIKIDNFTKSNHKKAYLYYMTPKGLEEKAVTTVLFLRRKMAEYERLAQEIKELKEEISNSAVPIEITEGTDLKI